MSSRLLILILASFLTALFFSGCNDNEREGSLRQTFTESVRTKNVQSALNAFEQLSTNYSVTEQEVVEAVWLMLFCEGKIEKAVNYLSDIDPSAILQKEEYIHLSHTDREAVQQLNDHYYRSYLYLRSFLACTLDGYERCQSVVQKSLENISKNTGVDLDASNGVEYLEISELMEIQSMSENSMRLVLQQRITETVSQCERDRVD